MRVVRHLILFSTVQDQHNVTKGGEGSHVGPWDRASITVNEAKSIAERKNTLAVKLANVAEIGAERMEEMIGDASLHDTTIATGVATDKVIALTSQTPSINIVNIPMPSAEERA